MAEVVAYGPAAAMQQARDKGDRLMMLAIKALYEYGKDYGGSFLGIFCSLKNKIFYFRSI